MGNQDDRTPQAQEHDIIQAIMLRQSAERADRRKETALAILFRNEAWQLENGRLWLNKETL